MTNGAVDVRAAAAALAGRLPNELGFLAEIAFNYLWSWTPGGEEVFRSIDPHRWELCGANPVRLLQEASQASLERTASDAASLADARRLFETIRTDLDRPAASIPSPPAAFLCTEFGVHASLPTYAGGLGILAGDILKEASDMALSLVGVGLLYRQGYFHQRVDPSGWQHEYWTETDPDRLPAALVRGDDGRPLTIDVKIRERTVVAQIWRVDVGRIPLYLIDAERPENNRVDRWITSRLYVGDRKFRLAQYALLGVGGIRALHAMGIDPGTIHLNEGHVAFAPLELARVAVASGADFHTALDTVRRRTVFTTHTPVAAGNEAYTGSEVLQVLGDLPEQLHLDAKEVLALGRTRPDEEDEPFGMTPLGLRVASSANGVSRRHGFVAREMWHSLYPDGTASDVPITHVTNGVHFPTWLAAPMRELLDEHLGDDWLRRADDPAAWKAIDDIPDADLWAVRNILRRRLVAYLRDRAAEDRLGRGEHVEYVEAATRAFDDEVLTVGFARRAATYKRLHLITLDPSRALRLLEQSVQLVLAGKPHPADEEGKRLVQGVFELKWAPHVAERVAYLEDYDLAMAQRLVAGCDIWLNVPRPPMEACGTSGMKAAINGGLNCSVLDGWWEEAYNAENGWAISAHPTRDLDAMDAQDANRLYDILENEAIPLFYDRSEDGVPHGWVRKIKASLRSVGSQFNATRMMREYVGRVYPR
ncbi:MAG: alpha-glucan family phosphorylase [Actinomycetota bacterium]